MVTLVHAGRFFSHDALSLLHPHFPLYWVVPSEYELSSPHLPFAVTMLLCNSSEQDTQEQPGHLLPFSGFHPNHSSCQASCPVSATSYWRSKQCSRQQSLSLKAFFTLVLRLRSVFPFASSAPPLGVGGSEGSVLGLFSPLHSGERWSPSSWPGIPPVA